MTTLRLILAGLGNVGLNFLRLMDSQRALLRERHDLDLRLVAAADSRGATTNPEGIDPAALLAHKASGQSAATFSGAPHRGEGAAAGGAAAADAGTASLHIDRVDAEMLLECTPVNLQDGQPGLNLTRAALRKGMRVVLANKGPLALAYRELHDLARAHGGDLRYSACVGGALPTINIGVRDLAGARITKVEAAVNGTCHGILRMMERGVRFDDALAEMQRRGVVEADPALDIDGWDEAIKLVIIANAVLRRPTSLADVSVYGIRELTKKGLQNALQWDRRITLLGVAEWNGFDYDLRVEPAALPMDHPVSRMGDDEMGVVYHTDTSGRISAFAEEVDAMPTAAAMLRDVIDLALS